MEICSKIHSKNLVKWAKDKPEVFVLSADLTSSTEVDLFRDTYPDRFLSMGMAEQNMMSFAGGMAREGLFPFVHTFGVFIYRRALDQVSMSIAYPNLPVRMFGFLPGIMTPGGATHQAIDDIAIMRTLPNMTVLEVGDATEVETILAPAHAVDGPVYVRMLRGDLPRIFPKKEPFVLNKARLIKKGKDVTLFSSGICTEEALRATDVLARRGVEIEHVHVSTLKPFSDPQILASIEKASHGVITMENHTILGGLGTCVSEVMTRVGMNKKLVKLGLKDTYAHGASRNYLMREYGLDAMALVISIEQLMGKTFKIKEEDLSSVRLEMVHSESKAEAL